MDYRINGNRRQTAVPGQIFPEKHPQQQLNMLLQLLISDVY